MFGRRSAALRGSLAVPGDKSISHRALILAALGQGPGRIEGLNTGSDVVATASCLERLNVALELSEDKTEARVEGCGFAGLAEASDVLDAGNSGTTLRVLSGVVAAVPGHHVLTGDASLRARPMRRIVEPLRAMGAAIAGRRDGDLAPLAIVGGDLRGVDHRCSVASAQVKSAVLLAGLGAGGRTSVTEPQPSRDHTERMLRAAGVEVTIAGTTASVTGGATIGALERLVPGDISSAFFLIVAAALTPGSDLTIEDVGLNPTRTGALEVLRAMGADISWEVVGGEDDEPFGTVRVVAGTLRGTTVSGALVPRAIDEIPALAVAATQAEGPTRFSGIGELRVKESDRIAALAENLSRLGAKVEATEQELAIEGPTPLVGASVDSRGDHRIALCLAVAGTIARGDVRVAGWRSVDTSFPEFLDLLAEARGRR